MDRAAVFAHYDRNNIIEDYVIYYLKELKKVAKDIIFVSDSNLPDNEIKKIENIVIKAIAHKHNEYDFGSYKRGFLHLLEHNLLKNYEELIFANDSCYGPLYSFDTIFNTMKDKDCDFWGINSNTLINLHIQSFFIVFKKQVFLSKLFFDFINSITHKEKKEDIINDYEVGLSQLLLKNGFKLSAYIKTAMHQVICSDLLQNNKNNPFLKTSMFLGIFNIFTKFVLNCLFKKYNIKYDKDLILKNTIYQSTKKDLLKNLITVRKVIICLHLRRKVSC